MNTITQEPESQNPTSYRDEHGRTVYDLTEICLQGERMIFGTFMDGTLSCRTEQKPPAYLYVRIPKRISTFLRQFVVEHS